MEYFSYEEGLRQLGLFSKIPILVQHYLSPVLPQRFLGRAARKPVGFFISVQQMLFHSVMASLGKTPQKRLAAAQAKSCHPQDRCPKGFIEDRVANLL